MMKPQLIFCFLLFLVSCTGKSIQHLESKDGFTVLPAPAKGEALATFSGGCFWAMQECMMELKGVNKVISGYAGGMTKNPTYETVLTKQTGHAESVQVYYNPSVISFEQLVEAFFYAHDPTQIDGQGPDYRSNAFYRSPEEYKIIRKVSDRVDSSHHYPSLIVTELTDFTVFYPAEAEHQDYYPKNLWSSYIRTVSKPKVLKLRKAFPTLIKSVYLE